MFRFSIARMGGGTGTVFQCIIDEAAPEGDGQGDLAAALEGVPEISVIGLDSGGMITSWNRGAEELFGYAGDEMIGRPWTRIHAVEKGKPGEANRELVKAARTGRYEGKDSRKRNDEGVVPVDVIIVPRFRGRDLVGFVEVSRDSSRSFSAREYRTAYERLKRLDEEKIERLGESNDQMRAELDRHAGMESAMREAHEKLRGANRELTGRIRVLSGALRKLIDQRKSLQEKAKSARGRNVDSEELVNSLPETLDWEPMTTPVPRILAGIAQRGRDVVVVFRSGEAEKRFMVRSGMIVSCSSNSPELLLGQLLVAAGELSESDRQKMIDVQEQTGISFGRLLLLFELMTEDQIREGMRRKIEREIEELGAWSEGELAFFESEIEPLQIVPVEVAIAQLSAELSEPEAVTDVDEEEGCPEELDEPSGVAPELVASSRARKFHRKDCAFVRRIPKRSRISLSSASEAEARGLSPCRSCLD